MKQRWRHLIASALALALCLSAAACGKSDDTAGDDWRASGAVVDSGTITHDGDSVDVLVTVSESSAAFYRDMPEQVLFDSVSFPVSIPDAEEAFHAISFDDIDGDGDPTMVDCGTIRVERSGEETLYYAVSTRFADVTYDFTLIDSNTMYWGGEYDCYQKMA